jgi:hypothetical protein
LNRILYRTRQNKKCVTCAGQAFRKWHFPGHVDYDVIDVIDFRYLDRELIFAYP